MPLSFLTTLPTGGQQRVEVVISGAGDHGAVASMIGAQHAEPAFRARVTILLTRTAPGALVFAIPSAEAAQQAAAAPAAKAMPASPAAPAAAATTTSLGAAQ